MGDRRCNVFIEMFQSVYSEFLCQGVGFILLWLCIFVSSFAMKMLAKAINKVPIRARFNVPNMPKAA